MSPLWDYFWPIFAAGLVIGALTAHLAYRRLRMGPGDRPAGERRRARALAYGGGAAAALVAALLWHGPLGASDRLSGGIEGTARWELRRLELPMVTARLERSPLGRRLVLSGPADDFQQRELVTFMDSIPGVSGVRWATPPSASAEPVR